MRGFSRIIEGTIVGRRKLSGKKAEDAGTDEQALEFPVTIRRNGDVVEVKFSEPPRIADGDRLAFTPDIIAAMQEMLDGSETEAVPDLS